MFLALAYDLSTINADRVAWDNEGRAALVWLFAALCAGGVRRCRKARGGLSCVCANLAGWSSAPNFHGVGRTEEQASETSPSQVAAPRASTHP